MLKAFITGIKEFRLSFCTAYNDPDKREAYDKGRELAHKVTLRLFEPG